jgi:predicted transport protein
MEFFQMLMLQKLGKQIADSIELDWKNPRVVCIAESYSKFDIDTVEVVPLRIELYKYRFYEDGLFSLEPINIEEKKEEAAALMPEVTIDQASLPSIEGLRNKGNESIRQLFDSLDERIRLLDETITIRPTQFYVGYRMGNNFADVHIGKNQIKIHLRPVDYPDPQGVIEKIPDHYNWTLNRRVYLKTMDDLDFVVSLIELSYKDVL